MLWVLNNLPEWIIHAALLAGVTVFLISWVVARIPAVTVHAITLRIIGLAVIVTGLVFEGGLTIKKEYDRKEAVLQARLADKATTGAEITIKTVEKLVYRDRVIVTEGAKVTEYIDRVAPQINAVCTLSDEFIRAHNEAAKALP